MPADDDAPFPYMRWAKRHLTDHGGSNLGMSGIAALTSREVPLPASLDWWAPEGEHGDPDLRTAIGARYGVPPDHVFATVGSSLANFLVYLAEARGAAVAVETPGYEALLRLPEAVGARLSTFRRVEERGWRIDPDDLRGAVGTGTRLLVVTDLHNPTGARLHPDDLALLIEEAERVDAAVLVDEVYLELDLTPRRTAALAHPRVIVTNSLTKAHGLGGLRVGWILGSPGRIERIARWNDLVCPAHPVASVAVARAFLPRADAFLARTLAAIPGRLETVDAWVRSRRDVTWCRPDGGITGFLRLEGGLDGDRLAEHAFGAHGVRVVPGSFFQSPRHVRISYGLPEARLAEGLVALGRAIEDLT
ncbi:MAG TPA: pyridoxal phosphate-dependent aminotransferase [Planctomycetota bacterium]|nr:pyridoxal phosphate-dependent aminotransferase [Planctomycetota bacterium]